MKWTYAALVAWMTATCAGVATVVLPQAAFVADTFNRLAVVLGN